MLHGSYCTQRVRDTLKMSVALSYLDDQCETSGISQIYHSTHGDIVYLYKETNKQRSYLD